MGSRRYGAVRLFGQVLPRAEWSDMVDRRPVIQPGAGSNCYLRNGTAIRVGADYSSVPGGRAESLSTGRGLVGIVVPLGQLQIRCIQWPELITAN